MSDAQAVRFEQRMSDMDALMWGIEKDPLLRSTITAVAVVDQAPDKVRLRDKVVRGLREIPRLRQRVAAAPAGVAPPRWVDDRHFDLDYHMRWVKAPGDGSLRDLLDVAEPIAMQGFDRARPLWEFTIVEGLADGRAALIQKVHHAVTDGVGGIRLALMLLDAERHPAPPTDPIAVLDPAESMPAWRLFLEGLEHERRRRLGMVKRVAEAVPGLVRDPGGTARRLGDLAASTARLTTPAFDPLSPIMRERSLSVHFDVLRAPLAELKAAAKRADGRLNDAFVAAVAGGLGRYHRAHNEPVEALRMNMPINIRSGDGGDMVAGNQFVPARFAVPIQIVDPVERMRAIRELVGQQRNEPALGVVEPVAGVLNRLPLSVTTALFGGMLKGVDFTTSNVPGVPFQVFLAGAGLEANFAFGPLAGAAANLTLLSYLDEVQIGVNTDPAAVPDPELFADCIQQSLDEIIKLA